MNFDIEKSLTYLFKEANWKKKALIGSLVMLGLTTLNVMSTLCQYAQNLKPEQLSQYTQLLMTGLLVIIILAPICIIATTVADGYYLKTFNQKIFKPTEPSPDWTNWLDLFVTGFKSAFASFIYMCLFLLTTIIASLILTYTIKNSGSAALPTLIFIVWEIVSIIIISIILIAGRIAFATNLKFSSYFDYEFIGKILFNDFLKFFIYALLVSAIGITISIICGILELTIVGIIFAPFLYFYQNMVQVDIGSQFARMIYKMDNQENTDNQ